MNLDRIFMAYDIRGRVPEELDEDAARRIGAAFASFTGSSRVALGHDCRLSSPALAKAFREGVTGRGADVLDLGMVTTDMVYFVAGKEGVPGAVVTASHNPPEWNGIKLCRAGAAPVGLETGLREIKELAARPREPLEGAGSVRPTDVRIAFVDHLLGVVDPTRIGRLRVAADAGNGMAGLVLPAVFERIPAELLGLYLEPDGRFPNHPADPLRPENLRDLLDLMGREGPELGVAFDGDADRAFFVDDQRRPLSGSTTTAIIARWFLQREPGAVIVHNLITSRSVPETVERYGGKAVRTRVGHSFIKEVMAETGALFGGEHSGHYYFRANYRADSGLLAMLVLLQALSEDGRPLSEIRAELEPYAQSGEINLEAADQGAVLQAVGAAFSGESLDWTDGLTVEWEDRWFNLRPSNTEPVLRLNAEAQDEDGVEQLVERVTEIVERSGGAGASGERSPANDAE
ncbi:MAG: phosphomannomutase/phosphoglucomutase [Acidimicrobiia bacterium]